MKKKIDLTPTERLAVLGALLKFNASAATAERERDGAMKIIFQPHGVNPLTLPGVDIEFNDGGYPIALTWEEPEPVAPHAPVTAEAPKQAEPIAASQTPVLEASAPLVVGTPKGVPATAST